MTATIALTTTLPEFLRLIPALPVKDREFALDLARAWRKYGDALTDGRRKWVNILFARATGTEKPAERKTEEVGSLDGIIALFNTARKNLKSPGIVLAASKTDAVKLNVAGPSARVPGSINVVDANSGTWYGRIKADGKFEHTPRDPVPAWVAPKLAEFAANPAKVAADSGRLTAKCCFCSLPLGGKDPNGKPSATALKSLATGYGETCAHNYGLPWGEEKASGFACEEVAKAA